MDQQIVNDLATEAGQTSPNLSAISFKARREVVEALREVYPAEVGALITQHAAIVSRAQVKYAAKDKPKG